MAKKKKSKHSVPFKISWWFPLVTGIAIGVSVQQIPQVRAYTDEFIQPSAHHFAQESTLPGHPISSFHVHRQGYSLAYDASRKNPAWVYEHLTAEKLQGNVDRSHFEFKEDESLPKHLRVSLADYRGSGFDRGHMAPAGNNKSSPEAMSDTFFMSNMCPQSPECNRGHWAKLEKHVRDLTRDYQNIFVITGPLYLPTIEENGKRYVKYEVIGLNDVAVPTHFFKVITFEDWQGRKETRAYILPNEAIPSTEPLDSFRTTVQRVEKAAGIIFNKGD